MLEAKQPVLLSQKEIWFKFWNKFLTSVHASIMALYIVYHKFDCPDRRLYKKDILEDGETIWLSLSMNLSLSCVVVAGAGLAV